MVNFALTIAYSEDVGPAELETDLLAGTAGLQLDTAAKGGGNEFRYGMRRASDSHAKVDIAWTLTGLEQAVGLLSRTAS
jgi:hypothetical protein